MLKYLFEDILLLSICLMTRLSILPAELFGGEKLRASFTSTAVSLYTR